MDTATFNIVIAFEVGVIAFCFIIGLFRGR